MDLTNIIVAAGAMIVAFIGGLWARPKLMAEARKVNAERDDIIIKRLYGYVDRLTAQMTKLEEALNATTAEVIHLRERMQVASEQIDAGQPGRAEETLKKAASTTKAKKT